MGNLSVWRSHHTSATSGVYKFTTHVCRIMNENGRRQRDFTPRIGIPSTSCSILEPLVHRAFSFTGLRTKISLQEA